MLLKSHIKDSSPFSGVGLPLQPLPGKCFRGDWQSLSVERPYSPGRVKRRETERSPFPPAPPGRGTAGGISAVPDVRISARQRAGRSGEGTIGAHGSACRCAGLGAPAVGPGGRR